MKDEHEEGALLAVQQHCQGSGCETTGHKLRVGFFILGDAQEPTGHSFEKPDLTVKETLLGAEMTLRVSFQPKLFSDSPGKRNTVTV